MFAPTLTDSLESLGHRRNVSSLSLLNLFYSYHFGICSSEMTELALLPCSCRRFIHYSDRLHDCSITVPRCYKDAYVNSFFPRTARH